ADLLTGTPGTIAGLELLLGQAPGTFFAEGTGSTEFFDQENTSFSAFGQVDYRLTDQLTATLGLAYINDEKDVEGRVENTDVFSSIDLFAGLNNPVAVQALAGASVADITFAQVAAGAVPGVDLATYQALLGGAALGDPTSVATVAAIQAGVQAGTVQAIVNGAGGTPGLSAFQFLPPFVDFPNGVEGGSTNDDKVTVTARLAYDVNNNVNIYGSYATGYKASSWNLTRDSSFFPADEAALRTAGLVPNNRTAGTRFAGPEETTVFELGAKLSFDNFNLNVAAFDQTIEGFQSTIFSGTGFVLANAGEQSTVGVEFDATWFATDNLTLTVAGILQDPEYDEFTGAAVQTGSDVDLADGVADGVGDISGQTPAGIPETSLFIGGEYTFDVSDSMSAFVRADYVYESEVQVVDNIVGLDREVGTLNASFGADWDNGLNVTLWGRNINDDEQFTSGFPTTAQQGSVNTYPNAPATYGITLRKDF
ncbi:MAG: TonB-dependent receptor, partial [Pseudomonadota bacterium]